MAKKNKEPAGEQLDLIDVSPANSKQIIGVARRYQAAQSERIEALVREKAEKQKILDLVKGANLQQLADGKIRFKVDGMTITVTPRDELVQIKDNSEEKTEQSAL